MAMIPKYLKEEFGYFHIRYQIVRLIMSLFPPNTAFRLRVWLLRLVGFSIGRGSSIFGTLKIVGPPGIHSRLVIGKNCEIGIDGFFDLAGKIILHDNVVIGPQITIVTGTHTIGQPSHRAGYLQALDVEIGEGVWIGARCTILPGVKIGRGSILAAGAVVAKSVEDNVLVGGVPAKVIRALEDC